MKTLLRFIRHPIGITVVVLLLVAGGLVGARYIAWPFYKDWREQRWLNMADRFYEQEDLRGAGLVLRKVIDANPTNVAAWEKILSIAKEEDPQALLFIYRQLATLKPDDEELHYEWATAAIQRSDFEEAATALEEIGERDTGAYHRLAAAIAVATRDFESAEAHFHRLLEMNPDDDQIVLNRAVLRLQTGDEERIEQARRTLAGFVEAGGDARLPALRALMTDALTHNLTDEAIRYMDALRGAPNRSFSDHFLVLRGLDRYRPDEYDSYLSGLMARAGDNIAQIRLLARFLNSQARRPALREWIESLPPEVLEDQEVNKQYIETLVFMNDLPALEARLRELPWEQDDFYRYAILAHTLREQDRDRESRETWQRAVIAAQDSIRDQRILYLQAAHWNWEAERLDLLSRIYHRNPREGWAFVELFAHYQETRNTPEMTRLFSRQVEVAATDPYARNNLAYLWLLQRSNLSRAHSLAREVYTQEPDNAQFGTTYAFSLYRQGRYRESLNVFEEMPEDYKTAPERALHYGLVLAANQRWEEALAAVERVSGQNLFPEEDRLLEEIRGQITQHL